MAEHTRRDVLKITAGAAVSAPLLAGPAPPSEGPQFFTAEEFQLVDELTEMIIPADEHSPGARAAQVAAYIDKRLAETVEPEPKQLWKEGLKLMDALSVQMNGRRFMEAAADERLAVLSRAAENEFTPHTPEERFFRVLKARTVRAYYTSKIGIHAEMEYKGNTYLKEFAGHPAE
ncbi:MAG: gluconate 2-dehydrogenase subunit 3 family protein [Acidobacteria bacterium]|nr:gluconate 2-dehydrogenase subunit 3 family protein [Acidobacteriota bacterium]